MITCGVDIGSRSIEVVLFDGSQIIDFIVKDTGAAPSENAQNAFESIIAKNDFVRKDIDRVLATGYGRNYFNQADRVASEIICHAAGVVHQFPEARTIIDIGGQDSKMIQVDEHGRVMNFVMNDRCAAGTGKFIEMVANTLSIPLSETGPHALETEETCDISSMCAVFAESEIIGLLHKGMSHKVILRGVFKSVAKRTLGMAGKTGLNTEVVFTGGVALNVGVHAALKIETGIDVKVSSTPQITGALGAAIMASRDVKK